MRVEYSLKAVEQITIRNQNFTRIRSDYYTRSNYVDPGDNEVLLEEYNPPIPFGDNIHESNQRELKNSGIATKYMHPFSDHHFSTRNNAKNDGTEANAEKGVLSQPPKCKKLVLHKNIETESELEPIIQTIDNYA